MGILLLLPFPPVGAVVLVGSGLALFVAYRVGTKPSWKALVLVRRARSRHTDAEALEVLDEALGIDPNCAAALFDSGEHLTNLHEYSKAAVFYYRYLVLTPGHTIARQRLAEAYLGSGQPDAAVEVLVGLRDDPVLTEPMRAAVTAEMAYAFIDKHDYNQEVELANSVIGRKRTLDYGQSQCLAARGVAAYLSGHRAQGIRDMDRLFAQDPSDQLVHRIKDAMASGTYGADNLDANPTLAAAPAGGL